MHYDDFKGFDYVFIDNRPNLTKEEESARKEAYSVFGPDGRPFCFSGFDYQRNYSIAYAAKLGGVLLTLISAFVFT
jgi:hypothetical protein